MNITGIDHFVLTVEDVEATCEFYTELLDAEIGTYADGKPALHFGDQKINLHSIDTDVDPSLRATNPLPGAGDFCLITDTPIDDVKTRLEEAGIDLIEGPVERGGAVGRMRSVYFRDPDDNLVEVAEYIER